MGERSLDFARDDKGRSRIAMESRAAVDRGKASEMRLAAAEVTKSIREAATREAIKRYGVWR